MTGWRVPHFRILDKSGKGGIFKSLSARGSKKLRCGRRQIALMIR
jgi:hypothetical protein